MHQHTAEFAQLFRGFEDAYGIYSLTSDYAKDPTEKRVGRAASKKGKITLDLWDAHLNGNQGLGIIPITAANSCRFGAIDIDQYPLDLETLNTEIQRLALPLVLCRTKSGGVHLYLFLATYISATIVVNTLRTMASQLGHGGSEIFPRQTKILVERGDVGQWINMPYFSGDNTERYALDRDNRKLDCLGFLQYAQGMMQLEEQISTIRPTMEDKLEGGPPCLNRLVQSGFPKGTRNNGLMNLGVYAKKLDKDNWEKILEGLNAKHMDPPLTSVEVQGVIKSLRRKEYQYTCNAQPIQSYCDKTACKKCKFGVGNYDVGMPKFGTLTKVMTVPPIWFLDVEGGERLELATVDLQTPLRFQERCMSVLNIMPGVMKRDEWTGIVQKLLENVTVIEVPEESTPRGQLLQHLEDFCTSRVSAKTKDELILGKPYTERGWTMFRMQDFYAYLERHRFKDLPTNYIMLYLRDLGIKKGFANIKGKGINWVAVPEFKARQVNEFDTPDPLPPEF